MATRKSFYDLAAEAHAFKLFACLGAADARALDGRGVADATFDVSLRQVVLGIA